MKHKIHVTIKWLIGALRHLDELDKYDEVQAIFSKNGVGLFSINGTFGLVPKKTIKGLKNPIGTATKELIKLYKKSTGLKGVPGKYFARDYKPKKGKKVSASVLPATIMYKGAKYVLAGKKSLVHLNNEKGQSVCGEPATPKTLARMTALITCPKCKASKKYKYDVAHPDEPEKRVDWVKMQGL